ncbi:nitrous oxide reductase accessory protein NosL [Puia sp. P3]|uniref:nitrous oxide reductase accessory protein NosL n=1 Tax=Puia sp. P3 TaxID=3423952 RepID=UPI003D66CB22
MKRRLSSSFRGVIFLLSLAMVAVLYLPIWKIELSAPQYPEGLNLQIYANRIGGDVDVVNGLNHYIGMHTLHTRDFVEFVVLPFIIGGFALLGFLVALVNRRAAFYGWAGLFVLIAFTSMIDFYRWEYNYGHNLNPEAPIQVPGMAYQPPLLGYKQLLNFGAYSIPDTGGWIFVGVGVALAVLAVVDLRKRWGRVGRVIPGVALVGVVLLLQGCQTGPEPILYGQDDCSFCKMSFTDKRFGGEVCTKKGKVYKFDDLHCLVESMKAGLPSKGDVGAVYFVSYLGGVDQGR